MIIKYVLRITALPKKCSQANSKTNEFIKEFLFGIRSEGGFQKVSVLI